MTKEELKQEAEEKCVCTDEAMQIMYRIGYIDGAEPREKRIAKLEKELAVSEHDREHNDYELAEVYKKAGQLEKENTELKKRNLSAQDAVTTQMYTNKANKEIADKQLTKAKEIIENIIRVTWGEGWNYSLDWKVKAERFLNSEA